MQEFSIAFGRVSRATFSANPELKSHISDLVGRAYFNLHASSLASADSQWTSTIIAACLQLCLDIRVQPLANRQLIQLFENVIRISEEHLREARRHAAMASNVFYLKETSLDAVLHAQTATPDYASATVIAVKAALAGRLADEEPNEAA